MEQREGLAYRYLPVSPGYLQRLAGLLPHTLFRLSDALAVIAGIAAKIYGPSQNPWARIRRDSLRVASSKTGYGGCACWFFACRGCTQTKSRLARVNLLVFRLQRANLPKIDLQRAFPPSGSAILTGGPSPSDFSARPPSASDFSAEPPSASAIPAHPHVLGLALSYWSRVGPQPPRRDAEDHSQYALSAVRRTPS